MRGGFFDGHAERYDRARPGYPEALVDDVLAFAGLAPGERALEIGCGTGQATEAFAARGLPMLCLEPGPRLAARARTRLAPHTAVEVAEATFEDWPLEAEGFGLVLAARSLHWVAPRARYRKTARALRPGGVLAAFGSAVVEHDLPRDVLPRPPAPPRSEEPFDGRHFGETVRRVYAWTRAYNADADADLLATRSRYRDVPPAELERVRETIEARGGTVLVPFETRLRMARRLP